MEAVQISETTAEKIKHLREKASCLAACDHGEEAGLILQEAAKLEEEWWPKKSKRIWDKAGENVVFFPYTQEQVRQERVQCSLII